MIKILLTIFYLWSSVQFDKTSIYSRFKTKTRKLYCCYSRRLSVRLLKVDYFNNSTIIIYFRICSCSYCQDLIQKFKLEWIGENIKRCKNSLVDLLLYKCISFVVGANEQVLLFHTSGKVEQHYMPKTVNIIYMYSLFLFSLKCHFFVY